MKYKCKLTVSSHGGDYYIGVNCFSWRYSFEYFCIDILRGENELLNYYKNLNINKIANQIKDRIIKEHGQKSNEVKEVIKLIESTKKITIDI